MTHKSTHNDCISYGSSEPLNDCDLIFLIQFYLLVVFKLKILYFKVRLSICYDHRAVSGQQSHQASFWFQCYNMLIDCEVVDNFFVF